MSEILRTLAMVFGVGLVIFVHEFGHFLAARLSAVRVDVFSLGFGPRLLAWRRGPTLYQIALLPLGGYVRMAGEEQEPGRAPAPHELQAKSVGARFFIYAGGVLMNVLFALVVFPIVLAAGVPMVEPVIGATEVGGPAWRAGVEPGSRVLSVNGHEVIGFDHIGPEVALGSSESTTLVVLPPGAREPRTFEIPPVYSKGLGVFVLGLRPAVDREGAIEVTEDSAAWKAGLRTGDRLLGVGGAPAELSIDEQFAFAGRAGERLQVRFARANGEQGEVELEPLRGAARGAPKLGVLPLQNWVSDLRPSAAVRALGIEKDDRIVSANGVEVFSDEDLLLGLRAGAAATSLVVERNGERRELHGPGLAPAAALALWRDLALGQDAGSARIVVAPGGAAAAAGMQNGDRIVSVAGRPVERFDQLSPIVKETAGAQSLEVVLRRREGESEREFALAVEPRPAPDSDYGLRMQLGTYTYQAPSPAVALRTGIWSSWRLMADSWLTLKRIATGQVSGENVGGIITIGVVSYSWAGQGLAKLFYFLCMLSVSLAFLNVLPIPVLDGGHLFFLLIEKIKGSPVSERVLSYSQIVGLVLIVSLVVYVTFNDIQRWIIPH